MPTGETKLCTSCGPERGALPIEDFEVTRTNPTTGHRTRHSKCRECRNAQRRDSSKAWYGRNAEYQIGQVTERRAEGPGEAGGRPSAPSHVPRGPETAQSVSLTAREWVDLLRWGAGPSDALRRLLQAAEAAGLRPPA